MNTPDLQALIETTPDARGECDKCHCESDALFIIDPDEDVDWMYCRTCIRRVIQRRRDRECKCPYVGEVRNGLMTIAIIDDSGVVVRK